jgi:hypothetical protein
MILPASQLQLFFREVNVISLRRQEKKSASLCVRSSLKNLQVASQQRVSFFKPKFFMALQSLVELRAKK